MHTEWVIIAVTALISGGSAGVAVASGEAQEPISVTIGETQIGDQAIYSFQDVFTGLDPQGGGPLWEERSAIRYRVAVNGIEQIPTAGGHSEDVVVEVWEDEATGDLDIEYTSLEGRYVAGYGLGRTDREMTAVVVRPPAWPFPSGYSFGQSTLTVGDDLTAEALRVIAYVHGYENAEQLTDVYASAGIDWSMKFTVIGGATWDGQSAVAIEAIESEYFAEIDYYQRSVTTLWYVDGAPRPVFHEIDEYYVLGANADGSFIEGYPDAWGQRWTANYTLESFTPGTTPIEWGSALPERRAPAWGHLERHPLAHGHPAEGDLRVDYRLEDAHTAVESDPLLPAYQEWREENPDAVLLSGAYSEFSEGPAWTLTYGEEQEAYEEPNEWFSVRSMQGPLGIAINSDKVPTEEGVEPARWRTRNSIPPAMTESITLADADRIAGYFVDDADWNAGPVALDFGDTAHNPWGQSMILPDREISPGGSRVRLHYANQDDPTRVTEANIDIQNGELIWLLREPRRSELRVDQAFPDPLPPAQQGTAPAPPENTLKEGAITVAVAAGAISLLTLVGVALRTAFIIAHSRVYGDRVLQHPLRRALLDALDADPAVSTTELHARLEGTATGTIVYHLDVLRREGYVRRLGRVGQRRWVPIHVGAMAAEQAAVLKSDAARHVYEHLLKHPGQGRSAVADAQAVSVPAVSRQLTRLRAVGLLDRKRDGKGFGYYALAGSPAAT